MDALHDELHKVVVESDIYPVHYEEAPIDSDEGVVHAQDQQGTLVERMTQRTCESPSTESLYQEGDSPFAWFPYGAVRDGQVLVTTDLDEDPISEPDYINLHCDDSSSISTLIDTWSEDRTDAAHSRRSSTGCKITKNFSTPDENIYEEINVLQRRLVQEQPPCALFGSDGSPDISILSRRSLVEEVLDEVARVRLRHDSVLNQLNLDLEHFLKPQSPVGTSVSDSVYLNTIWQVGADGAQAASADNLYDTCPSNIPVSESSIQQRVCVNNVCDNETGSRSISNGPARKITSHVRSNSTIAASSLQVAATPESIDAHQQRPILRSESLDFSDSPFRRQSFGSRGSSSSFSPTLSEKRHSIRNLHQGIQQSMQGIAGWTGKCGHLLAKQSKKIMGIVHKGKKMRRLLFYFSFFFPTVDS